MHADNRQASISLSASIDVHLRLSANLNRNITNIVRRSLTTSRKVRLTKKNEGVYTSAMKKRASIAFLGVLSCFGQPLRSGTSVEISPAFARHGVSVITSADASFESKVADLLPPAVLSELRPLLPFVIVIHNNSQAAIARTTVRYERTTGDGRMAYGWSRLDTSSKTAALAPDGTLIHTPRTDLSLAVFAVKAGKIPPQGVVAGMASQIATALFDARRFPSITVSLDSVVFANGGIVGPDNYNVLGEADATAKVIDSFRSEDH
jgi:hypothetical protein